MTASFQCECGGVRGSLADACRRTVNRVTCYCCWCRTFALKLGRAELLDSAGGSDIVQVAAGRVTIDAGGHAIRGLRLSPSGPYRWFASCCGTPIANMAAIGSPALGMVSASFRHAGHDLDALFGLPLGGIYGEQATRQVDPRSTGLPPALVFTAVRKVLGWKLSGRGRPNPFTSTEGQPLFPVDVAP